MAVVMIHACPKREWYVKEFLLPSLREQGINEIKLWMDSDGLGCLEAFVASCESLADVLGGTWHLQDDVIISHDFGNKIIEYDYGVVCGYGNQNFGPFIDTIGKAPVVFKWWSFPCIRIPNDYAGDFAKWYRKMGQYDPKYEGYVRRRKGDDYLFRDWLIEHHPKDWVMNLKPNIVDHVDYLLGGSTVNQHRVIPSRAYYFEDRHLVQALEDILATRA